MKWQKYRRKHARKQAIAEGTNHWKNKRHQIKVASAQKLTNAVILKSKRYS